MIETPEHDLEVLGLTGVEDKLQMDVRPTLESIRNAGIKVRHFDIHVPVFAPSQVELVCSGLLSKVAKVAEKSAKLILAKLFGSNFDPKFAKERNFKRQGSSVKLASSEFYGMYWKYYQ